MVHTKVLLLAVLLSISAVAFGQIDIRKARGRGRGRTRVSLSTKRAHDVLGDVGRNMPIKIRVGVPEVAVAPPDRNENLAVVPEVISNHVEAAPATKASPCQTAAQWEGRSSEWDHILGNNNRYNVTFDGINRRKRVVEDKHAQLPGKRIYEYIMLYDEGFQYVINHNYNTCTIEPLGTWRNHTIPPNSTLEDLYEIGAPGSEFMVQEWSDRIPGRQKERWIGTFTDEGCWPITEIFMEKDEHNVMIQSLSTRFFDLSSGIKNMSIFTPPSYCHQTQQTTRSQTPIPTLASTRTHPAAPRRNRPSVPRTWPNIPRRFPNVERIRPGLEQLPDLSQLPDQGRVLLEQVLSGDHRQLPAGVDRVAYDTIGKMYRAALKTGRVQEG